MTLGNQPFMTHEIAISSAMNRLLAIWFVNTDAFYNLMSATRAQLYSCDECLFRRHLWANFPPWAIPVFTPTAAIYRLLSMHLSLLPPPGDDSRMQYIHKMPATPLSRDATREARNLKFAGAGQDNFRD